MNFLPTLVAWQWAVLAAVPIGIILLYFLKLRRHPLPVSSTFLWQRTVEDLHVNSLLQRLRRNLLLFLQLLVVTLAAVALLRPGWQGDSAGQRRTIFLLDASASMAANDLADAPSRFDEAKKRIAEQIDAMRGGDAAMVIAFSDQAEILHDFTTDRRRLREALSAARVTQRPTDLNEALRAAVGLANPYQAAPSGSAGGAAPAAAAADNPAASAALMIYSDGGVRPLDEIDLSGVMTTFVRIGSAAPRNLGILGFSAERDVERPEQVHAFARIVNFSPVPLAGTVTLLLDDQLVDAEAIDVEAGDETGVSFELTSLDAAELTLELEVDDQFAPDNTAHAALRPLRGISILLVTPGNEALELALQTDQVTDLGQVDTRPVDYLASDEYLARAAAGRDDLIIFDRCTPKEMPAANTFFIGALPPQEWSAGDVVSPVLPVDIERTHPLMRFLDLYGLKIVEGRPLEAPRGAVSLITADSGPVLALAPRAGFQDLVMGFDVLSETDQGIAFNTDWPVQRSWPVFVYNVLRNLGGAVAAAAAPSHQPGQAVTLRVDNRLDAVRVEMPERRSKQLSVAAAGQVTFSDTERIGAYRVMAPGEDQPINRFTINLFDSRESDLQVVDAIQVGRETIAASAAVVPSRSELWRWLLIGALGMLAVEWFVFNRRVV